MGIKNNEFVPETNDTHDTPASLPFVMFLRAQG
eukprot:CAMPEP_0118676056 /NCGR_PEP_ID=MMETSP0800-20121206/1817_1 /TAXON_ID=210618 ORGANISM="Striatella unipunctata, Strain CCMP2910" /NCGR_SAMPLE_ID=MMETSP0800 /ASSEMBLY_ACC=CAM_ASM_000638 /LENGTH=32 /DNA_ID= /DNA_START= /DNA_END= /DNA_ORIENTATION=